MTRSSLRWVAWVLGSALIACSPPGALDTSAASSPLASEVVRLTNAERARKRIAPLEADARLMRAAQIHADQMARAGQLDHQLPRVKYPRPEDRLKAAKYPWRAWAENVAYGPSAAGDVIRVWMNSSEHRTNILATTVTQIGVGHAKDKGGRVYWVQVFARPLS